MIVYGDPITVKGFGRYGILVKLCVNTCFSHLFLTQTAEAVLLLTRAEGKLTSAPFSQ